MSLVEYSSKTGNKNIDKHNSIFSIEPPISNFSFQKKNNSLSRVMYVNLWVIGGGPFPPKKAK